MTLREPWKPRILRRFGRLLATAFAVAYVVLIVREASSDFNAGGAALIGLLIFATVSAVVSWLTDRVGAAMLILAGVALACGTALVAERNQVGAAIALGGPFLLAGLALLAAAILHEEWLYPEEEADEGE